MKVKDIDRINGAIDKPSKQDKELRDKIDTSQYDVFGLQEHGSHRKYGHDALGLARAMQIDPINGASVYMSHMMMDMLSNNIRNMFGTDARDIGEVFFNRILKNIIESNKQHYRKTQSPYIQSIEKRYKNKFVPPYLKHIRRNKFYRYSNNRR